MTSLPASVGPAGAEASHGLEAPDDPEAPDRPEAPGGQESRGGQESCDGAMVAGLPSVWLRFTCWCPLCLDPVSGQRLLRITDIPADISVAAITAAAAGGGDPGFVDGFHAAAPRGPGSPRGRPASAGLLRGSRRHRVGRGGGRTCDDG